MCLWGAWGVHGGWMPLPTCPQRYCDPASLVLKYMDTSFIFIHCINSYHVDIFSIAYNVFYRLKSFLYLILFKIAESWNFFLSLHIFCIPLFILIQRCLVHLKYFVSFVSLQQINIRKWHIRSLICLVACMRLYNPLCPFVCPLVRWSVGPSISQSKFSFDHCKSFQVF